MISFIVRLRFEPEDHDAVAECLRALTAASRKEPGCVSYVAHFVEDDANIVVIYEQYMDQAAVEAHRASPHFAELAVGCLYQKMKERSVENLTAVA
ncbi:MAG TPA: putative quinol monooxygenase [Acidobacteriaceae bacterium]|nr:putative quinol monooxygenase [Acidobacteriaceae bacterium]